MFMHNYNQEQKMKIKHIHKIFLEGYSIAWLNLTYLTCRIHVYNIY